jgi:MinD superfamily P-loop ATPase
MQYLLAGSTLELDQTRCNGCCRCEEVCPHAVIAVVDHQAAVVARSNCMQCGACKMNCPEGAIQVSTGVGCAQAVVMSMRRGKTGGTDCCCD